MTEPKRKCLRICYIFITLNFIRYTFGHIIVESSSCTAGQYSTPQNLCSPCSAGQFSSTTGATYCTLILRGCYSSTAGESAPCPAVCPSGTASPAPGSTACTPYSSPQIYHSVPNFDLNSTADITVPVYGSIDTAEYLCNWYRSCLGFDSSYNALFAVGRPRAAPGVSLYLPQATSNSYYLRLAGYDSIGSNIDLAVLNATGYNGTAYEPESIEDCASICGSLPDCAAFTTVVKAPLLNSVNNIRIPLICNFKSAFEDVGPTIAMQGYTVDLYLPFKGGFCPPGSYNVPPMRLCEYSFNSTTSVALPLCGAGEHWDKHLSACLACLPGTYSSPKFLSSMNNFSEYTSECLPCTAGSVSNAYGSLKCTACSPGYYSTVATSTCFPVDQGCFSTAASATSSCPQQCKDGYYSTGGATACTPCGQSQGSTEELVGHWSGGPSLSLCMCASGYVGSKCDTPVTSSSKPSWTLVRTDGTVGAYDAGINITDALATASGVFYSFCVDCVPNSALQTAYYKRLTPVPSSVSLYNLIGKFTAFSVGNVLNVDFQIFSTYSDLTHGTNPWQYCPPDSETTDYAIAAFPGGCAPSAVSVSAVVLTTKLSQVAPEISVEQYARLSSNGDKHGRHAFSSSSQYPASTLNYSNFSVIEDFNAPSSSPSSNASSSVDTFFNTTSASASPSASSSASSSENSSFNITSASASPSISSSANTSENSSFNTTSAGASPSISSSFTPSLQLIAIPPINPTITIILPTVSLSRQPTVVDNFSPTMVTTSNPSNVQSLDSAPTPFNRSKVFFVLNLPVQPPPCVFNFSISMTGGASLNGYFCVNPYTNLITSFYEASDLSTNILAYLIDSNDSGTVVYWDNFPQGHGGFAAMSSEWTVFDFDQTFSTSSQTGIDSNGVLLSYFPSLPCPSSPSPGACLYHIYPSSATPDLVIYCFDTTTGESFIRYVNVTVSIVSGSFPPTTAPSAQPTTASPTAGPSTAGPSSAPSVEPSKRPSSTPSTDSPSSHPSCDPTTSPSVDPSTAPSLEPSFEPSFMPSSSPSTSPTVAPSKRPSSTPSITPTRNPSVMPSFEPSVSPSANPTAKPSKSPSFGPTPVPSRSPSHSPSFSPTPAPTTAPSISPTSLPSMIPFFEPSFTPSVCPSQDPSVQPSQDPTVAPSSHPSQTPTRRPTRAPVTRHPSSAPTSPTYFQVQQNITGINEQQFSSYLWVLTVSNLTGLHQEQITVDSASSYLQSGMISGSRHLGADTSSNLPILSLLYTVSYNATSASFTPTTVLILQTSLSMAAATGRFTTLLRSIADQKGYNGYDSATVDSPAMLQPAATTAPVTVSSTSSNSGSSTDVGAIVGSVLVVASVLIAVVACVIYCRIRDTQVRRQVQLEAMIKTAQPLKGDGVGEGMKNEDHDPCNDDEIIFSLPEESNNGYDDVRRKNIDDDGYRNNDKSLCDDDYRPTVIGRDQLGLPRAEDDFRPTFAGDQYRYIPGEVEEEGIRPSIITRNNDDWRKS